MQEQETERAVLKPQDNIAIWVLLGSAFVVILNETVTGVALPVLLRELGITPVEGQWLTTAFLLTMSVVIPVTGTLIQRYTTRALFFTAMGFFFAGTLICALAPGFEVLVAGRVVQAVGTAITMPLMMTTLITVVPPQQRGQIMGRTSMVISMAPALGPTVSGLILQSLSWRFLFILMLPIIAVATLLAHRFLRNVGAARNAPIDLASVLLSIVGFGGLVYGLSGFGHGSAEVGPNPVVPLLVGVAATALFVWRQLRLIRAERPLLDLRVFTHRTYTVGLIILASAMMSMFGTIVLLPIYAANVLGMQTLQIGLLLLPGGLFMGLMGPIIGRLVDRFGTRAVLTPGLVVAAAALWLFTLFGTDTSYWFVQLSHLLFSCGLAFTFTPLFSATLGSLPPQLAAHGSATLSTAQQLAGAAGVALFVTVFALAGSAAKQADPTLAAQAVQAAGIHVTFTVSALLLTALILVGLLMPGKQTLSAAPARRPAQPAAGAPDESR